MTQPAFGPLSFEELAIWRTDLPDVKFAVLPSSSNRPNPRLRGGMLFVSVFASGCVCALDAGSGEIRWRRELPYLASSPVESAGDILLAQTAQALYALEPETGQVIWEFSPYGSEGETLYSQPVVHGGRLFLGDRWGWVHCLDLASGRCIWRKESPGDGRRDVNSMGVVVGDLLIMTTTSGLAFASVVADGQPAWQRALDGPTSQQLLLANGQIVVTTESLYFLDPTSGEVRERIHWPGLAVRSAVGTPFGVAAVRSPDVATFEAEGVSRENGSCVAQCADGFHEIPCSPFTHAVRFSSETGLLYASGLSGLDILDPATGRWLRAVRQVGRPGGHSQPEVANDRIYALDGTGAVWALRHPAGAE